MADKRIPQIPSVEDIDALATQYIDAVAEAEVYEHIVDEKRRALSGMIERHGFVPPRAAKTRRLAGLKWKCSLSQSDSLEVDGTEADKLFAFLKFLGIEWAFRNIFRRRTVYVLTPKAQAYVESICVRSKFADKADQIRAAFSRCLKVTSSSPYLKVEPIEKEKEAKAS